MDNYVDLFDDSSEDDKDVVDLATPKKKPSKKLVSPSPRNELASAVAKKPPPQEPAGVAVFPATIHTLVFPGPPIAKHRPKPAPVRNPGRNPGRWYKPRTYNDQKKENTVLRAQALEQLKAAGIREFPIYKEDETLVVEMEFYRRLPNDMFQGKDRQRPLKSPRTPLQNFEDGLTPDVDNLAKMYMDAVNKIVYADDKQISKLVCYKLLDVEPPNEGRTIIWIRRLLPQDLPRPLTVAANPYHQNQSRRLIEN